MKELIEKAHANSVKHGFYDRPYNLGEKLMLIVSELSEALEADRKGRHADLEGFNNPKQLTPRTNKDPFDDKFEIYIKDTFEDEIADVFIRLFDLCGSMPNMDIMKHIELKMKYNEGRPAKHGKNY